LEKLEKEKKEKKEKELLSALSFEVMNYRQDQIKDSYKQTFEWIFGEPKSSTWPWNNFSTWLKQTDSSLYWINGKAASGKSTLMGFLADHHKTNVLLSYWSRHARLVSASFFFWNSGASLQRSQKGLLRSLLWQILSEEPALVPIAFPDFLTYEDISFYVTNMLDNNELMEVLRKRDGSAEVNALISDLVNKANGVWLWVELVVKSLLSG
jgi:hypothetical protein